MLYNFFSSTKWSKKHRKSSVINEVKNGPQCGPTR
jgi:hypothetical protein